MSAPRPKAITEHGRCLEVTLNDEQISTLLPMKIELFNLMRAPAVVSLAAQPERKHTRRQSKTENGPGKRLAKIWSRQKVGKTAHAIGDQQPMPESSGKIPFEMTLHLRSSGGRGAF